MAIENIRIAQPVTPWSLLAEALPLRAAVGLGVISAVINGLGLTGPLYMLQVYNRVLPSGSVPTLIALSIFAGGLYLMLAGLDIVRGRILQRCGERLDAGIAPRVAIQMPATGDGAQALRDLDTVRGFFSHRPITAVFDLPFVPVFLAICFLFHPLIGLTALSGALALLAIAVTSHFLSRRPLDTMFRSEARRHALVSELHGNRDVIRGMALEARMADRFAVLNEAYLAASRKAGDVSGGLGGLSRSVRLALQSAVLAVGAWLVIGGEADAGVMIASAIMMGRALAPVELSIGGWRSFQLARRSLLRLAVRLEVANRPGGETVLPRPCRMLSVENLAAGPAGREKPRISGISFSLAAGSALVVLGPSGAGKTMLARALVGVLSPHSGAIRLDGARLEQFDRASLGRCIGYLPQDVSLFAGTIAENIARFDPDADDRLIIEAARNAAVHDRIVALDAGYDTRLGAGGEGLSLGERQRIGLARALYGDPFLLVLDEPNAHLDSEGEEALIAAIRGARRRGCVVVVVAHRPSVIAAVDQALYLEAGRMRQFGPRDEVMAKVLKPVVGQVPLRRVVSAQPPVVVHAGRPAENSTEERHEAS